MSLQIAAVANAIEAMSIAGLTIKDLDNIPTEVQRRGAYMIPMIDNPSDMAFSPEAFWSAGLRFYEVKYSLNYRLLFEPIGTGRIKTFESVAGNVAMIGAILDKLLDTNPTISGVEELLPQSVSAGVVDAPDGAKWWGADISIRITEYVNP